MRHIIFTNNVAYEGAILIKDQAFREQPIRDKYIKPLAALGTKEENIIAMDLYFDANGKATASKMREYLDKLLPALDMVGTTVLYVCDSGYFKVLTKERLSEPHCGYALDCKYPGYEHMSVVLGINYQTLFYKPELQQRLDMSLTALSDKLSGSYVALGGGIIHKANYPKTEAGILHAIHSLHVHPELTSDIEAFSLKFYEAGIGTIAFAWDQHNGLAFPVDYKENIAALSSVGSKFGNKYNNVAIKKALKNFFETYQGKLIWHNLGYDGKVLAYELWMEHPLDVEGMLKGIEVMTRHFDDTQIITYLATNSTSGNNLKLKYNAHEFAGNYAQEDIKDIRNIPIDDLLEYNLVDCLSTWYVRNKNLPIMLNDQQEDIYENLMKPSVATIMQMELTGVPMVQDNIATARRDLEAIQKSHMETLVNSPKIKHFQESLKLKKLAVDNEKLKTKVRVIEELDHIVFNPKSDPQLQELIYQQMGYPVIDRTTSKEPSVGAKTIKKMRLISKSDEDTELFDALIGFGEVATILDTFINSFETNSLLKKDGRSYLHGSYRLGGTVSGRMSSSGPNMQNLPSTGSAYAKYTKRCFVAPAGWLIVGVDFNSLEDYVSALTTRDPNKLKIYLDGYDGHCYRAFSYWPEKMPDIVDTVDSINSIKKLYSGIRQDSKAPTFLLTYGGTHHGLMANVGFAEDEAKKIEERYHSLYKVSDEWVHDRITEATKRGYVEVAFGLRVRTPMLKKVILDSRSVPYEAKKEARTAGNALGQSYGLLNNRSSNAFRALTLASKYKLDILPIMQVHDSQYLLVRDNTNVVSWLNNNIIGCMQWQKLPELQHDVVKLGAEMDIHWPDWSSSVTINNNASIPEIVKLCGDHMLSMQQG